MVRKVVELDLRENAVYVVKKGKVTKVTAKEHGQDVIVWKNGEVLDVDQSERMRIVSGTGTRKSHLYFST